LEIESLKAVKKRLGNRLRGTIEAMKPEVGTRKDEIRKLNAKQQSPHPVCQELYGRKAGTSDSLMTVI
jgi:hypothetical protein